MKKTYLHILVIAIVGIISYSNSFNVPFQFDDYFNISENPIIKDPGNFTSSLSGYQYNPRRYLGYLSLALNYRYGGLDVRGYHIVNLLIHLINATLVYFLVLLTFRTPYFKSDKSEVSSKKEDAGKGPDTDGLSLLTTHYSLFTIPGSRSFVAFFSALLFVAHPIQTQAVTYIVQRFTSLAALFYLLSMVMYVKARLQSAKSIEQSAGNNSVPDATVLMRFVKGPMPYALCSLLSAVLAMKTKEIAFTLPIMILLYEFIFFRSTLKRKLIVLVPILLTLAIIPLSMLHIDKPLGELLSDLSEKSRLQTDMSRGDYLATEMRVIVTYIRLIVFPINQNLDYGYPIYRSFFSPPVFLSFLFLSGLIGTAVYLLYKSRWAATTVSRKKLEVSSDQAEAEGDRSGNDLPFTTHYSLLTIHYSRLIAFGILWFFLALSVESSFIPIVDVIFEHRLYLPSIGAFVALSAALFAAAMRAKSRWPNSERAIIPLVVIIVLILSAATFARNRVWQDKTRLWEDVVRKSPGNARAHNNLCFVYLGNGKTDQAIQQCTAALGLLPDYLDARINLGVAYNARGMYDKAIEHFLIALSMDPDDADAHNNLGIAYVSKGMFDEGIKHYQIAVSLSPDYAEAYSNLGVAYASKGLFDKARENFEYAIRLKPDYFEAYHNLALLYEKMGEPEKAAAMNSLARQLKPAS